MGAFPPVTLARLPRELPVQYLVPIAMLLTMSFGCLFALLFHLTSVQDRMERDREVQLVTNSVAAATTLADHDLRDYAIWDEAVVRLVHSFDRGWADDNLGPYLGREQAYDYVMVLDPADRPIYAYDRGRQHTALDPAAQLGPAFADSLRRVRDLGAPNGPLIAGYSRAGGEVYLFAVASIVPLTGKVTLPPGRTTAIAIARRVDGDLLRDMTRNQRGPHLRLDDLPQDGSSNVAIRTPSGHPIAYLSWSGARPGTALRAQIWPAFIILGIFSLAAAGVILRRGRRAVEALQFSEARAQHLAKHDLLTGLPNRRAMQEHLREQLEPSRTAALLYLDLDGFKETNDVYGHGAGDELLRAVANRLNDILPPACALSRVGGDEFAIVAPGLCEAAALASAILAAFADAFTVGSFEVSLGVSIGVAAGARSADELIRQADAAMYVAKAQGKHCYQLYDPVIDAGRQSRRELEQDLRAAVERGDITVVYQPIVSAATSEVLCVEALARWQHPWRGAISPEQFIPIAEESGLIVALGTAVLTEACRTARLWKVDLAVNLSPAQFWDRSLAATIEQVLTQTGFPPARLQLEITEGYLMRRPEAAQGVLWRLKNLGVRIALDDFGTGFASIGYLQQLAFDSIKIDRSFVAAAVTSPKAGELARAIVAIGDALDLPVTAEGVETMAQAELMAAAGCERLQGWLVGRPASKAEADAFYRDTLRLAG